MNATHVRLHGPIGVAVDCKPRYARLKKTIVAATVTLSTVIAVALLAAVVTLF